MKQKKESHWVIWIAILILTLFIIFLHWFPKEEVVWIVEKQIKTVGLASKNFCGYEGEWIHIRVENDSNYKRLISVCSHEAGHMLFCQLEGNCWKENEKIIGENYAEVCENYPRLCLNDERDFLEDGWK